MSETPQNPQLQGQMFLFNKPELISTEQHGEMGLTQPDKRYGFCASSRAIPLTVSEIPAAMKDYPVVFASEEQMVPLAITGLIDDVNLFVSEGGDWEHQRYIPGYIRRYPFGVATQADSDRFAIVLDTAFDGLVKGGENPLFENGEPSEMTQQTIEFCKTYEEDRLRTVEFGERIKALGVSKGQSAQFTPMGETEPRTFAEYLGVDENAIKELPGEKLAELRDSGILPLLYAMVMSMGNWRMLLQRRANRFNLTDKDILTQVVN